MREEVYAQAPGVSTFLGQTGEQWRCQSSTTPSRSSLEIRIMLFSRGEGHILTQVRNKMEIPVKDYIQEDCFTCRLNERYENGGATMDTPSGALWLLTH
jgi:hypothetical protein